MFLLLHIYYFVWLLVLDMCRKLKHRASKIFTVLHPTSKRHLNPAIFYSTNQENDCIIMTADFINCPIVLFVCYNQVQLESVFV